MCDGGSDHPTPGVFPVYPLPPGSMQAEVLALVVCAAGGAGCGGAGVHCCLSQRVGECTLVREAQRSGAMLSMVSCLMRVHFANGLHVDVSVHLRAPGGIGHGRMQGLQYRTGPRSIWQGAASCAVCCLLLLTSVSSCMHVSRTCFLPCIVVLFIGALSQNSGSRLGQKRLCCDARQQSM